MKPLKEQFSFAVYQVPKNKLFLYNYLGSLCRISEALLEEQTRVLVPQAYMFNSNVYQPPLIVVSRTFRIV